MSGRSLTLAGGPFPSSTASLWPQCFPESRWLLISAHSLSLGEAERGPCSSSCSKQESSAAASSLDSGHLRAAVGPDAILLAGGDLEDLRQRLVIEKDSPPVQNSQFCLLWRNPAASDSGRSFFQDKTVLHPGLEQLHLQTGFQTLVDGQLWCWVLHLS